jgi:hypothetical protein
MDKSFTSLRGKFIPDSVVSKFEEARKLSNELDRQVNILASGELVVAKGAEITGDTLACTYIQETKSKLASKWGIYILG